MNRGAHIEAREGITAGVTSGYRVTLTFGGPAGDDQTARVDTFATYRGALRVANAWMDWKDRPCLRAGRTTVT